MTKVTQKKTVDTLNMTGVILYYYILLLNNKEAL